MSEARTRAGAGLVWLVLPWVFIVLVGIMEPMDEFGDLPNLRVGSLLTPVPALAAVNGSPRRVLVTSVGALLVAVGTMLVGSEEGLSYHVTIISSTVIVTLAGLLASSTRERREAQLMQVQRVAEAAQLALLPPIPYEARGLRMEARYVAAESEARIGGDLYEVVIGQDHVRAIIGDVRGKGLPAIRTASAVLGAFREAAAHEPMLSRVAVRCSEAVARMEDDPGDVYTGSQEGIELFVTGVLVEIDGARLSLVNLGHPPPLLLDGQRVRYLGPEGTLPPLGLAHLYSDGIPEYSREWEPGERVLLYTDGIDEARDAQGRFFPLLSVVEGLQDAPIEVLPDRLMAAVDRHTGRDLLDDAAVVAVEWCTASDRVPHSQPAS